MSTLDEKIAALCNEDSTGSQIHRVHCSIFREIKEEMDRLRKAVDRLTDVPGEPVGEPYSACLCDEGHGVCYKIWHNGGRIHFQPAPLEFANARFMEALDKQEDGDGEIDPGNLPKWPYPKDD